MDKQVEPDERGMREMLSRLAWNVVFKLAALVNCELPHELILSRQPLAAKGGTGCSVSNSPSRFQCWSAGSSSPQIGNLQRPLLSPVLRLLQAKTS